jgi:hypothetical protein
MRMSLAVLTLLLVPVLAWAEAPASGDLLTDDEAITMCAEALPKHLECKQESCATMVKIRTKGKAVDVKAMEGKCLKELEVDGTGDLAARKARCATWIKARPMPVSRAEAKELTACWSKPTCQARFDCWAPKMGKLMEGAAPKKK